LLYDVIASEKDLSIAMPNLNSEWLVAIEFLPNNASGMPSSTYRYLSILILVLCFLSTNVLSAQNGDSNEKPNLGLFRNAFFLELGGNSFAYSVNYERFLIQHQSVRLGLSYYGGPIGVPLLYNVFFGTEVHQFEVGLGATLLIAVSTGEKTKSYATSNLSYRWIFSTETSRNFLRISFTPSVGDFSAKASDISFIPMGGISVGILY